MNKIILLIPCLILLFSIQSCAQSTDKKEESTTSIDEVSIIDKVKMEKYASSVDWEELNNEPSTAEKIKQMNQAIPLEKMIGNYEKLGLTISNEQKTKIYFIGAQHLKKGMQEYKNHVEETGNKEISLEKKQEASQKSRKAIGQDIYTYVFTPEQKAHLKTQKQTEEKE